MISLADARCLPKRSHASRTLQRQVKAGMEIGNEMKRNETKRAPCTIVNDANRTVAHRRRFTMCRSSVCFEPTELMRACGLMRFLAVLGCSSRFGVVRPCRTCLSNRALQKQVSGHRLARCLVWFEPQARMSSVWIQCKLQFIPLI